MHYAYFLLETDQSGVVTDWDQCKKITAGKQHLVRKFKTHQEALEHLLSIVKERSFGKDGQKKVTVNPTYDFKEEDIFFDSGTGRGIGVEASVTNYLGHSLLKDAIRKSALTVFGTYVIPDYKNPTNNYGELLALYFALKIALKSDSLEALRVFGDSQLVIDYWSLNRKNTKSLHAHTVVLIEIVSRLRTAFEKKGGKVLYISGSRNPADLGFHKD